MFTRGNSVWNPLGNKGEGGWGEEAEGSPPGHRERTSVRFAFQPCSTSPEVQTAKLLENSRTALVHVKGSNATMQLAGQNRLPEAMRSLCGASPEWSLCKASSLRRAWFPGASAEPPRRQAKHKIIFVQHMLGGQGWERGLADPPTHPTPPPNF